VPSRSLIVCAVLVFGSGCGTIGNFNDGYREPGGPPVPKVFGGVREDFKFLKEADTPFWVLVDLPLSLAGDVFTLPWAIKAARVRKTWPPYEHLGAPVP
jgi:uncharacterized protein YceK